MSEQYAERPQAVVRSSMMTILGSALVLGAIFVNKSELGSSDMREQIESQLESSWLPTSQITTDQVLESLNIALMVLAACCVIAAVLGFYILRRHRASRIGLTVQGGVIALLSPLAGVVGLLMGLFIAYTVSLLWRPETRAWFREEPMSGDKPQDPWSNGTNHNDDAGEREQAAPQDSERSDEPPQRPGPYYGFGRPEGQRQEPPPDRPQEDQPPQGQPPQGQPPQGQPPQGQPPQGQPPQGQPPQGQPPHGYGPPGQEQPPPQGYGQPGSPYGYGPTPAYGQSPYGPSQGYYGMPNPFAPDPNRRPGVVVGALVMTWIGIALMALIGLICLAFAGNQEVLDAFEAEVNDPSFSSTDFTLLLRVVGALLLLWALVIAVVSVFAWRRANWARITLIVMAGLYCALQLVGLLSGQLSLIIAIGYVATVVVLLLLPTARDWYAAKTPPVGYGGPGPGGSDYGGYGGQGYGGQGYGGQGGYGPPPQQPPNEPPRQQGPW